MLAKHIHAFSKGNTEDQTFYLACLKRVGRIAKLAYRLNPNPQFKQAIINLKRKLETYDFK